MKKIIPMSLVVITTVTLSILGFLLGGINLSDKQKDNFRRKWAEHKATRKDLSRYTRKIGTYVADVYGWKVRR